jgi:hypothetical protein
VGTSSDLVPAKGNWDDGEAKFRADGTNAVDTAAKLKVNREVIENIILQQCQGNQAGSLQCDEVRLTVEVLMTM